MMKVLQTAALFVVTAVAEILGCYLAYLWLRKSGSPLLAVAGLLSLVVFAWLLSLHPTGAARTYAAYGGVYIAVALVWLRVVEGQQLTRTDVLGASVAILGMVIIVAGHGRGT